MPVPPAYAPAPTGKFWSWKKIALVAAIAVAVGVGGYFFWRYRRRRGGKIEADILSVDRNTGEVYLSVNGAVKRVAMEPGTIRSFSPDGYVTLITSEYDQGSKRATRAKLFVFDGNDIPIPALTQDIAL